MYTYGHSGPASVNFGLFVVLALVWAGVPFAIAAGVARSRGEPIGIAILLTLVLGWIGLIIVLYGQRRTVRSIDAFIEDARGKE